MKKRLLAIMLSMALAVTAFAACGNDDESDSSTADASSSDSEGTSELSGSLTFTIWANNLNDLIEEKDMVGQFQEKYPDVELTIEKIKDDSEYWNAMKMRATADQLPDIMINKPFTLSRFQDYLVDLSDTQANADNELSEGYAVGGKVLGIPMTAGYEYVYYWKDMFEEASVEVPTTWPEFEEAALTLQEYYGADDANYMAIAMGLKDEWPNYPFTEFMPSLESGNGDNWNTMATQDAPFAEGTDIYNAYSKAYNLFTSGVLGKDPLGLGHDQAVSLFAAKKASIIAMGDWGLQSIQNGAEDVSTLGTFYLPTRNSESDPYNIIVQGDSLMGVTTTSENPDAAMAFLEWYYSADWYPQFLDYVTAASAMSSFTKEKDPILAESDALTPDSVLVMYSGSGDDFTAIQNETTFDYKKLGARMLMDDFDFETTLAELNEKWAAAREKLEIE